MKKNFICIISWILFLSVTVEARILKVGKDYPFTTINAAVNYSQSNDVILITDSRTYVENVIINEEKHHITITTLSGNLPILMGQISLRYTSFCTIKNLTIQSTAGIAVEVTGDNCTIRNCHVYSTNTPPVENLSNGIVILEPSRQCRVLYNKVENFTWCILVEGENNEVGYNLVLNGNHENILVRGSGCHIHHNSLAYTEGFDRPGYAAYGQILLAHEGANNNLVENNSAWHSSYYFEGGCHHNIFQNNIIVDGGFTQEVGAHDNICVYNLVYRGQWIGIEPGEGCLNGQNPLFIDLENLDFGLQLGSPALRSGLGGKNIGSGSWKGGPH